MDRFDAQTGPELIHFHPSCAYDLAAVRGPGNKYRVQCTWYIEFLKQGSKSYYLLAIFCLWKINAAVEIEEKITVLLLVDVFDPDVLVSGIDYFFPVTLSFYFQRTFDIPVSPNFLDRYFISFLR